MAVKRTMGGGAMTIDLTSTIEEGLKKFKKVSADQDFKGKTQMGLALMNAVINGSPKERVVPPIDSGLLRGSGSVFVGGKLVGETPKVKGKGTPAKSYRDKEEVVTVGFNTEYAIYTHEKSFNPGPVSRQSGDVGYKWMEKHLLADKDDLIELYGKLMEKRLDSNK